MRVVVDDLSVVGVPCPDHPSCLSTAGDQVVVRSRAEAVSGETVRVQMRMVGTMSGRFTGWIEDGRVVAVSVEDGVLDVPDWMSELVCGLVELAESKLSEITVGAL